MSRESPEMKRLRLEKQGYTEFKPGRFSKSYTPKTEFNSTADALAHHDSQRPGGDLIDNAVSDMVTGGGSK